MQFFEFLFIGRCPMRLQWECTGGLCVHSTKCPEQLDNLMVRHATRAYIGVNFSSVEVYMKFSTIFGWFEFLESNIIRNNIPGDIQFYWYHKFQFPKVSFPITRIEI